MRWTKAWLLPVLIAAVAAGIRFYRLADFPPGLHYDEAFHQVEAVSILQGYRPIYFPENMGMDPLHIYLIAWLYRLVGVTAIGGRLVSAIAGTLTVPATWWVAQELFAERSPGQRAALGAAGAAAAVGAGAEAGAGGALGEAGAVEAAAAAAAGAGRAAGLAGAAALHAHVVATGAAALALGDAGTAGLAGSAAVGRGAAATACAGERRCRGEPQPQRLACLVRHGRLLGAAGPLRPDVPSWHDRSMAPQRRTWRQED